MRPGSKESERWIEGYARVAELAEALPDTRLVYVVERESDIVELMVRARELGTVADWLLHFQHNRALALFLVVAWRVARLMRLGRGFPDLDAQLLFEPEDWKPLTS